jgi:acyl-CoA thioester hydrolase
MHKNFTYKVKIYYANYLNFLERARTEAITNIGLSNKKIKEDFGALIIVK